MVGAPRLIALSLTANPAPHQRIVVEIQIVVDDLPIDKRPTNAGWGWRIGVDGLGAEIEFGQAGNMGEVNSWIDGGAPGSADRRDIVMYQRIGVQRQPAAHKRQPVSEIETGVAGAGIVARKLDGGRYVVEAGERIPEGAEGNGYMPFAAENIIAGESKLQILGGLEADLLSEHIGANGKLVAVERSKVIGHLERPQEP